VGTDVAVVVTRTAMWDGRWMTRKIVCSVALAAVACALAPTAASATAKRSVLRLASTPPTITTIDVGPAGKSPGDLYVVAADVMTRSGRFVGRLRGTQVSIAIEDGAETVQAHLTFAFRDGSQISIDGIGQFPLDAKPGLLVDRPYRRPIVGGSGRYAGARGELVSVQRADGHYDQTFRFVR
jgi:hypothetical protein